MHPVKALALLFLSQVAQQGFWGEEWCNVGSEASCRKGPDFFLMRQIHSQFTLVFLFFLTGSGLARDPEEKAPASETRAPNIIVILSDDHRADYLGCAGHPVVKTPNIDQLAAEGSYFTNAFVTSAACTPNRTCLLTGQYERKHGVTFGSASSLTEEAFLATYPMLLRKAGYFTGYVGKNHTPVGEVAEGENLKLGDLDAAWNQRDAELLLGQGKHGYNSGVMEKHFDYWYGNHNHTGFYSKNLHPVYKNAEAHTQPEILREGSLNFLKQNPGFAGTKKFLQAKPAGKPFCLLVNFNVPHSFSVNKMRQLPNDPELYRSTYRDEIDQMPLPETYLAAAEIKTPKIPRHVYNGKYIETYDFVKNEADLRERAVRTCQTVTGIDRLVGSLITELQNQKLYENTIIVFTSDHGLHFGEHGLGGKVLLYEESIRVPLIIFDPRQPADQRAKKPEHLVLTIDIAPTLLDLAGLPIDSEMQGRSLRPVLAKGGTTAWRSDFFAENMFMGQHYPRIEAVRNAEFKYIRYFDKKKDKPHHIALTASINGEQAIYEELYDLNNDPTETTNLVASAAHQQTLESLRKRCQEFVVEAKGSDAFPKTRIMKGTRGKQ